MTRISLHHFSVRVSSLIRLVFMIRKLRDAPLCGATRCVPCLLHDNAAPHTAKLTKETLESLGFRVLPHSPYSLDLAPSDFHLFWPLQWFLRDKTLETEEEVRSTLDDCLLLKTYIFTKEKSIASFKNGKM